MSAVGEEPDAPQRLSPIGIVPTVAATIWQTLFGLIATGFGLRTAGYGFDTMLLGILAIVALIGAGSAIRWWRTSYAIGAQDIRLESGLFSRQARSVPYERIQDVSVEQPLLARIFSLVELTFETGAGGKDDLALSYVTKEEGERLRRLVRRRREQIVDPEQDAAGEENDDEVELTVFTMVPNRIALFGLFEFSLVLFGVLVAGLQQFDFLLPFDIWDATEWRERFGGPIGLLIGSGARAQLVIAVLGLIMVGLVGLATGVARTFAREYDFTLTLSERGFRRRRGLFTRTDVVMPVHRVQAGIVASGWLRRKWGWHGLKFVSLAQDAGSSNHDAAPFAQIEEIEPIVAQAGLSFPPQGTRWRRPAAARWIAEFGGLGLMSLGAGVLLAVRGWPLLGALTALVLVVFVAFRQWLDWRLYGHAMDEDQLYRRSGLVRPKLVLAPRQRIQSVEIRQGPLGRLARYVDLHFGLPGGRLKFVGVRRDEAYTIRASVSDAIAATDYSRLEVIAEA